MNSSVHRWVVGIILTDLLFIKRLKFRLSINGRCGLLRLMINARGRPMKKKTRLSQLFRIFDSCSDCFLKTDDTTIY